MLFFVYLFVTIPAEGDSVTYFVAQRRCRTPFSYMMNLHPFTLTTTPRHLTLIGVAPQNLFAPVLIDGVTKISHLSVTFSLGEIVGFDFSLHSGQLG